MSKLAKDIIFIVLMLIAAVMLYTCRSCNRPPEVVETTTIDTIQGDSIPYLVEVDKPVPHYIDTGGWYYYPIDTLAILKDYLSKVIYIDTLMDDSSAFIALVDTVYKNRIQGRLLYFANRKPTTIIHNTTTTTAPRARSPALYAGAMAAVMPDKVSIGPAVLLTLPKGYAYSYAYGINTKTHIFTFVYKVQLKRKVPE